MNPERATRAARREDPALLLTCEHASRAVPARFAALFAGRERLLASHRGWDPGALELARRLARRFGVPLFAGRWTRLLVDLNRPPGDPELFSSVSAALSDAERARLLEQVHAPHWAAVTERLEALRATGRRVVHLGVHSFTPQRRGERRPFDVGILFDPERPAEAALARDLRRALARRDGRLRLRFNEPYLGIHPGLTSQLRTRAPDPDYAGLELEVNQRLPRRAPARWRAVQKLVEQALVEILGPG